MKFTAKCKNLKCPSTKFIPMQSDIVLCKKCGAPWYIKELPIIPQLDEENMKTIPTTKLQKEAS